MTIPSDLILFSRLSLSDYVSQIKDEIGFLLQVRPFSFQVALDLTEEERNHLQNLVDEPDR